MAADVAALLASYARLGLFKHISTVCSEVIAKRGNDPVIVLWSAFGSAMEGEARRGGGGARRGATACGNWQARRLGNGLVGLSRPCAAPVPSAALDAPVPSMRRAIQSFVPGRPGQAAPTAGPEHARCGYARGLTCARFASGLVPRFAVSV